LAEKTFGKAVKRESADQSDNTGLRSTSNTGALVNLVPNVMRAALSEMMAEPVTTEMPTPAAVVSIELLRSTIVGVLVTDG